MPAEYGGQHCLDPAAVRDECAAARQDTRWWFDLEAGPNGYTCPLGGASGHGAVVLLRASLDALDTGGLVPQETEEEEEARRRRASGRATIEAVPQPPTGGEHDLVIYGGGLGPAVRHKYLHVVEATCLLPGRRGDPLAPYLVTLADRRRLLAQRLVNVAYNLVDADGDDYLAASTDAGTPWAWDGLIESLWAALGSDHVNTYPGLPFAPEGTPENWDFRGSWRAIDALSLVLGRLGCALRYDSQTAYFDIVQLATDDEAQAAYLRRADNARLFDGEPHLPALGRVPQTVRVLFPILPVPEDGGPTHHELDVPAAEADEQGGEGTAPGTIEPLLDDLAARHDMEGAVTNAALLASRAAVRAAAFYRLARAEPWRASGRWRGRRSSPAP